MKECKDIYELKDILYEKFDYWDVEDLTKSIKSVRLLTGRMLPRMQRQSATICRMRSSS